MNRYWLFAFENYYPSGGMLDYKGSFNSFEQCKKEFVKSGLCFGHIFDSEFEKIIHDFYDEIEDVDWHYDLINENQR